MSNTTQEKKAFFNKHKHATTTLPIQANPANAFRSIFDIQKLDETEERALEQLLFDHSRLGEDIEEANAKVAKDAEILKKITSEARSINKQGILLVGERIFQAREILKNYENGRGAFTKWLQMTFGSRSSAYNCLSYYEFYQSLPDEDLRVQLKKMPYKAAYALASRDGNMETKSEIIRDYHTEKAENILPIIQEKLPITKDSKNKRDTTSSLISKLEKDAFIIKKLKEHLNEEDRSRLNKIAEEILSIVKSSALKE